MGGFAVPVKHKLSDTLSGSRFIPRRPGYEPGCILGCMVEAMVTAAEGYGAPRNQAEFDSLARELGLRSLLKDIVTE